MKDDYMRTKGNLYKGKHKVLFRNYYMERKSCGLIVCVYIYILKDPF